jgi:sugar (pentulose or hexulose) kinase
MANEVTSLGCHTDLWNPYAQQFSDMVDTLGWMAYMAPVRKANERLGVISAHIAEQTGLDPATPVICGIHDSNASLYAHLNAQQTRFAVVSSGTWVVCMAVGGLAESPDPLRDTLVNVNALGHIVPSARFMGGREFDRLMEGCSHGHASQDMDAIVSQGIMHLPALETGSGPYPASRGHWRNGPPAGDGQRFVAASFYLALMTATSLRLTGARGPSIVEGPLARNMPYLDMLTAATGCDVMISTNSATGTAIGAAMLTVEPGRQVNLAAPRIHALSCDKRREALKRYGEEWQALAEAAHDR